MKTILLNTCTILSIANVMLIMQIILIKKGQDVMKSLMISLSMLIVAVTTISETKIFYNPLPLLTNVLFSLVILLVIYIDVLLYRRRDDDE